jgi:hypothetical protein
MAASGEDYMRTLMALAVALFVTGCGDDTSSLTQMDMASKIPDMAVGPDMVQIQTCKGILQCAVGCGMNLACALGCPKMATNAALANFVPLQTCVLATCGPGDGGNHSCSGPTDTSATCIGCIGQVGNGSSMAGMPCHTEYSTCASN